jgi:glyoxylase-like metal-dependent hydrolase (beta-lactamase superfamily II)
VRRLSRREFMASAAALMSTAGATAARAAMDAATDVAGRRLTRWRPGLLDIHHIATGRGDSTLIVAPDGTTILIDAGATMKPDAALLDARPDSSRRPGEWIARYVKRRLAETDRPALDALLVTHLHPDHIGAVGENTPLAASGQYRLTGVTDIAAAMPVRRVIDSDFPDYGYTPFEDTPASENYVAFVRDRVRRGASVERFKVGDCGQMRLEHGTSAVPFEIRNLTAKGVVWSGHGQETIDRFPPRDRLPAKDLPNVNAGSTALRLSFGTFEYFCGGDLTDWADAGTRPWMDALTPAAEAAGRVDVAVVPHHGLFDASGSAAVRALAARVWVISAWHASHPSITTLERLFNERLFAGPRSVYTTGLSPAADLTQGRLTRKLASREGHVVIRVAADGRSYQVVVTSNADEADQVRQVSEQIW